MVVRRVDFDLERENGEATDICLASATGRLLNTSLNALLEHIQSVLDPYQTKFEISKCLLYPLALVLV